MPKAKNSVSPWFVDYGQALRQKKSWPVTLEVSPPTEHEGGIRRCRFFVDKIKEKPEASINTSLDLSNICLTRGSSVKVMGYRPIIKIHEEETEIIKMQGQKEVREKKKWKFFEMGNTVYMTGGEISSVRDAIGSALIKYGATPKKSRVMIYIPTGKDWFLIEHACFTQAMTIVTAYETLGEDGLRHSLKESEVTHIFTTLELLPLVSKVVPNCPAIQTVIVLGTTDENQLNEIQMKNPTVISVRFEEFLKDGHENPVQHTPPASEDIACIMYTSGSTGSPKGVLITHSNIVSTVAGCQALYEYLLRPGDVFLAFLPLAHIFEFIFEMIMLYMGAIVVYGSVKTLTPGSVRNCECDLMHVKPTIMIGVPLIFDQLRKAVLAKLRDSSPFSQKLFHFCFKRKLKLIQQGRSHDFYDRLIFKKINDIFGGNLRILGSGGAPLALETQQFIQVCLCEIFFQGYGMTEATGIITTQLHGMMGKRLNVGVPVAVEIKLVDVEESSYSHNNKPKPQGEVWMRGPSITKGYLNSPEANEEMFKPGGWLASGDIGEWNEDGTLSIIDRKKNLVKLNNGEYIAYEKLESIYKSSIYVLIVDNMCVYADSLKAFPVAIVLVNEKEIRELAKRIPDGLATLEQKGMDGVLSIPAVNKEVLNSLVETGKRAGLKGAEIIQRVILTADEWTPASGLLTDAMKLKRRRIAEFFAKEIDAAYAS